MKKFALSLMFAASLGILLHAGHLDDSHASLNNASHHCFVCQTSFSSNNNVVEVPTPRLDIAEAALPVFVVLASKSLALLSNPRAPPLA